MTSQPGLQTIAIHILPNISGRKSNQTMKLCQLIDHIKKIFFFKDCAGNEAGRLSKLFSYMTKKSRQKCKYLENEKSF